MWHLIEDFFDQSWFMKLMLGASWLCVIIMIASLIQNASKVFGSA